MSTSDMETPSPKETGPEVGEASHAAIAPRNLPIVFGLAGLAIGLVLGLVSGLTIIPAIGNLAGGVLSAALPSPITSAVETCNVESNPWITIGDEGQSLSMNSLGEESAGAEFDDVFCVLDALDTPDSVLNRMNTTRALDGRQSAGWDNFSASWGYHPDNGLDVVIDVARE
jgi:hypothetical protein